jgi:hypothetical protein
MCSSLNATVMDVAVTLRIATCSLHTYSYLLLIPLPTFSIFLSTRQRCCGVEECSICLFPKKEDKSGTSCHCR